MMMIEEVEISTVLPLKATCPAHCSWL